MELNRQINMHHLHVPDSAYLSQHTSVAMFILMTSYTHKRSTHTCLTSDTILMTNHCTKLIVLLAVLVVQQHSLHISHKNNNYVHIYAWIYTRYVFISIDLYRIPIPVRGSVDSLSPVLTVRKMKDHKQMFP
jgi:hypothetical protein